MQPGTDTLKCSNSSHQKLKTQICQNKMGGHQYISHLIFLALKVENPNAPLPTDAGKTPLQIAAEKNH